MSDPTLLLGPTLLFEGDPFAVPWEEAVRIESEGGVLIQSGVILEAGSGAALRAAHPQAQITSYGADHLICPGFVDAHVHYPQTAIIASWGKRLRDWLNDYTLYCTIHPHSVDALFEAAAARGLRIVAGKTCMDRNAPEGLRDTAQSAYDDSKTLIDRWHGKGRATYAITPRFSPTSTPEQLQALGDLWAEHPTCMMQTHLSEQTDEIAWMRDLYPQARDYLDTYEAHGLLGARGLYGHAIHLEPREIRRLTEVGAAVVHCPTSNTFIGSGLFDMAGLAARGIPVGLATDTGGGSSFSMLRTMAAAYEIGQLRHAPLHAAQLLWLATAGSARSLHLGDKIGTLGAGMEADVTVLNLSSTAAIAQRAAQARDIWEAVFATVMMGDDRAIADVWVAGQRR